MADGDVTYDGARLIETWAASGLRVERLREQLEGAERDAREASAQLGRWMSPRDVTTGETFCVRDGDSLIQVHVVDPPTHRDEGDEFGSGGSFSITVRKRGRRGLGP